MFQTLLTMFCLFNNCLEKFLSKKLFRNALLLTPYKYPNEKTQSYDTDQTYSGL